jgi:GNAT superfamily N-acetyltransferase
VPGIRVRAFTAPDDIEPWLALRTHAVAGLIPTARPWTVDDFRNEMLTKPWWRPDHTWLAIAGDLRVAGEMVGAVTLALREGRLASVPVIHWLLVDPAHRRRGIARLLMVRLELAAWEAGHREVQLETHANWHAAGAFYQSIGYAPLRERSPR